MLSKELAQPKVVMFQEKPSSNCRLSTNFEIFSSEVMYETQEKPSSNRRLCTNFEIFSSVVMYETQEKPSSNRRLCTNFEIFSSVVMYETYLNSGKWREKVNARQGGTVVSP